MVMNKRLFKYLNRFLIRILPHITIVLSTMFIVFWILDIYNPLMNILNCQISNVLLIIFCIASLGTSITTVVLDRKNDE